MVHAIASGDRSEVVFAVTCSTLLLATAFIAMRLTSKLYLVRKPTWDDLVVVVAWVFAVGVSSAIMLGARKGLGKVDADIEKGWELTLKRCDYAFTVLYNPALTLTKLSILMLYHRLSQPRSFFRYGIYLVGLIVILGGTVLTLINLFQCRPVRAAFSDTSSEDDTSTCVDIVSLYICSAPVGVLTDLAILLLPLPTVTAMRLDIRQKVGLVATFITGLFVAIVDVVRIAYLQAAFIQLVDSTDTGTLVGWVDRISIGEVPNLGWYASYCFMWSAVEVNVGLMCASALVIKPLLVRVLPGRKSRRRSTGSQAIVTGSEGGQGYGLGIGNGNGNGKSGVGMFECRHISDTDEEATVDKENPSPSTISKAWTRSSTNALPPVDEDAEMDIFEFFSAGPPLSPTLGSTLPLPLKLPNPTTSTSPIIPTRSRRYTITSIMEKRKGSSNERDQHRMDFVDLGERKALTELTRREGWRPVVFVSLLFWTWGFAYGLVSSTTRGIQNLVLYSSRDELVLHEVYWIGYVLGPTCVGYWILTRFGFKATFMTGLGVFTVACLTFWPSSTLVSFPGFIVSNVLVATGLSILEVAANPFIALAGPDELMEARLNFSQGFQATGLLLSPLIAVELLFKDDPTRGLFNSQWIYLAAGLWASALGVLLYYVPLNEASDEDLERVARRRRSAMGLDPEDEDGKVAGWIGVRRTVVCACVLFVFCYIGAQEQLWGNWSHLIEEEEPGSRLSAFAWSEISVALFAANRFIASGLCYVGVPGWIILLVNSIGCFITSTVAVTNHSPLACELLFSFFEGPIYPTLYAMTLRGLGRRTKLVAVALVVALAGGGVWPAIAWKVEQSRSTMYAMWVIVAMSGAMVVLAAWIGLNPLTRRWVSAVRGEG